MDRLQVDKKLRIAIVHDWLVVQGGAEKVLAEMLHCFPQADLFATVDFLSERDFIGHRPVQVSWIQKLPFAKKYYRTYLPLMPLAVEQFDLSQYDLIISSSHAVAKGVLVGPDQLHLCYCHSPIRYAWDLQHQYLREAGLTRGLKAFVARVILHYLRIWDLRTVPGVDHFIANSKFIQRRIHRLYRRPAQVIYPPVAVDDFALTTQKEDFYLTVSRLVPYKQVKLIAEAFAAMPERRLVIIGDGPQAEAVRALAHQHRNIQYLGEQPFAVVKSHMQRAKAFVFAAEEDFGIAPVEAQACGTPVIAYGRGGATETILDVGSPSANAPFPGVNGQSLDETTASAPTGVFFASQTKAAICQAITTFEQHQHEFTPQACRANALRFSSSRFRQQLTAYVTQAWAQFDQDTHKFSEGPGR